MKLKISDDLILGADFVTSTQAILAQKGKGKTHTATVEAEELLDASQQIVVIDPTDAWFGLRSSPDGRSTGYPIAVFGGEHGDVQLEPSGGAVLAEAIVRERFSAIVCTETMTKAEELRFLGDFLEALYRKNREAMHLFLDEADILAPQQPYGGEARTCGATDDIVRRGRKKGIGCTLITQRASVLNKNVLSQADMLVALGCSHPLDLDAIDKWVRRNADPKLAAQMMASLPSLPRGEAWAWNPSQHLFKRVAIRQRHTFDSGATPKAGEKKREPKILAPIDIARLGKTMAEAVERQRESDPKALRAKIGELVKERDALSRAVNTIPAAAPGKTKIVEKPVLRPGELDRAEKLIDRTNKIVEGASARLDKTIEDLRGTFGGATARLEQSIDDLKRALVAARPGARDPDPGTSMLAANAPPKKLRGAKEITADWNKFVGKPGDGDLSKCERTLLVVLAQHPTGVTRKQALTFAGYARSGTTNAAFARLLALTYARSQGTHLIPTEQGATALGSWEPLPIGDALRARLLNGSSDLSGVEKVLLGAACAAYPNMVARREALGTYARSGTTNAAFARLIAMGYLRKVSGGIVAGEELFG